MIDVTLLGTAATMPLAERALSAARLRCAGRSILFDCGEGTQTAARRAGVSLMKTDLIALTHYHGDHIFGLPGLMQTLGCLGRTEPLFITGPEGLENAMRPILLLAGGLPYPVRLITERNIRLSALHPQWPEGAVLESFAVSHRVSAQGYRFSLSRPPKFDPEKAKALGIPVQYWKQIQNLPPDGVFCADGMCIHAGDVTGEPRKGLRVVFSGDTAPCESLEKMSAGADLLICDATYGKDEQQELAALYGHSTFREAGELAGRADVSRLWLTHFSQTAEPEADIENAKAAFPNAECGEDGKTETLTFP